MIIIIIINQYIRCHSPYLEAVSSTRNLRPLRAVVYRLDYRPYCNTSPASPLQSRTAFDTS
jgi:hypothetical protein